MVEASAPGKVILLGEHAVVYERPAIAVPVSGVRATASLEAAQPGSGLTLLARDLGRSVRLEDAAADDPLAVVARLTLAHLGVSEPDAVLTVTSTIPIAGGMGSGAAVSTTIVRVLAALAEVHLSPRQVSDLVYEVEKLHHGTPSGIDNTVVAFGQPVYFVAGRPPEALRVGEPLCLLIADTGIPSPTRKVVGAVRRNWEAEPVRYDFLFDRIADLVEEAREAIKDGDLYGLGAAMDQNHELLREVGVSSRELDDLVEEARLAGALGAKLSGAGRGGNVVVLVEDDTADEMEDVLKRAGAAQVILTCVK
jgi:mevalonate kinase